MIQQMLPIEGLSPRVRGNQYDRTPRLSQPGSIPAGAGEPHVRTHHQISSTVYPRGCGGTRQGSGHGHGTAGLSPRVRGNHSQYRSSISMPRSIPAGAGEPPLSQAFSIPLGVYPRGCGGTKAIPRLKAEASGLSPRVRGNRKPVYPNRPTLGSIPAGAGNQRPAYWQNPLNRSIPAGAGEPILAFGLLSP